MSLRREIVNMAAAKKTAKPVAVATPATEPKAEAKKVETPAAEVKTEVKAEAKAAKPAAKKETVKKETKTAAKKAPAKKETKTAAKKAPAKKAVAKKAAVKAEMQIQFAGKSYTQEDLVKIAQDVWQYDLNQKVSDLTSVELYVKPEEQAVYYVMNKEFTGSFAI